MAYTKKPLTPSRSEVQNLLCMCYRPPSGDLSTLNTGVLLTKAESTFFISFKTFQLASQVFFVNKTEKRRTHYFAGLSNYCSAENLFLSISIVLLCIWKTKFLKHYYFKLYIHTPKHLGLEYGKTYI